MDRIAALPEGHEEIQALLPWYVTERLDRPERGLVERHLASCAECRADAAMERRLKNAVADLPLAASSGWATLRGRIAVATPAPSSASRRGAWLRRAARRPGRLGWVAAAPVAALMLGMIAIIPATQQPAPYRTLGDAPPAVAGNVIVIFRQDQSERELHRLLDANGARLIGGPTSAGVYVLAIPPAERAAALAKLRARPDIAVAEPIDAAP